MDRYNLVMLIPGVAALSMAWMPIISKKTASDVQVAPEDGLVSLAATLVVYSVNEMLSGYGFVAVFVAAVMLR